MGVGVERAFLFTTEAQRHRELLSSEMRDRMNECWAIG